MKIEIPQVKIQVENLTEPKKEEWKRTPLEESASTLFSLLQKIKFTQSLERLEQLQKPEDQKKYYADAFRIFRSAVFLAELDGMIRDQKDFISENAESEAQLLYGRGIIYGLVTLRNRIEELHSQYVQDNQNKSQE